MNMIYLKIKNVFFKNIFTRIYPYLAFNSKNNNNQFIYQQKTFSQFGEDLILDLLFIVLKNKKIISDITYLDIGGYSPYLLSNTYLFYTQGYRGVVIEPNKILADNYKKSRPNDLVLNIGIHFNENSITDLPFYQFNSEAFGLSTFSKESADENLLKCRIATKYDIIMTRVKKINEIIKEYFDDMPPTFISLDTEGLDLNILNSFNFKKYRPVCWIIETAELTQDQFLGRKIDKITEFMLKKQYEIYADTYINTIFIDKTILQKAYINEF
jgi:hypothetical protein